MNRKGITLIELLIALAILSVAMSGFTYLIINNMRFNASSGFKSQAAQILNYLGRRAVNGDGDVLPSGSIKQWGYTQLSTSFTDLAKAGNLAEPDLFRAEVSDLGPWTNEDGTVSLQRYRVRVCWKNADIEECIKAHTLGPKALAVGVPPPLPGLN
jgi:prepilin-type N-terminal cleavage/methylation domain-containing protein